MLKNFALEKFDVLIQAGQSNSMGYSFGNVSDPYAKSDLVWYLNPDFTFSIACESVLENSIQSNFSLSFAREYIASGLLEEGRKILILRSAVGGTGFADKRWGLQDDLYLRMMEMTRDALSLNPENRLKALLWHQGENEAMLDPDYDKHYQNLSALVSSVRKEFGAPALPFIAGDFVQEWKSENLEKAAPIADAIRAVCKNLAPGAFIESDGLLSNRQAQAHCPYEDNIHFCRESIYELGRRYFKAYREITRS